MKRKSLLLIAILIISSLGYIGASAIFSQSSVKTDPTISHWTCGMHPEVRRKGPGKCPICAMDLVPVKKKTTHTHIGKTESIDNEITLSPRARLLASVHTTKVTHRYLSRNIRAVGKVDYNEKSLAHVSAWIGGRIDKLYVDFTGSYVRKGQALLKIYSPKLISTQDEYITLLKNISINNTNSFHKQFIHSIRRRLQLMGMTKKQLQILEKTHKVETHTTIYSPINGTVIKKYAHEGMYFKVGQKFYDLANLNKVWVHIDIYEYEISKVRVGQWVSIELPSSSQTLHGRVTFIDPVINPSTRTVKVRAEFWNRNSQLRPNMYVNARIKIPTHKKVLAVPKSAVLDTGIRQVVYIEKKPGIYTMRQVKLGILTGDYYPIKLGLKHGDRVVTSGAFLIDSQTQLTGGSNLLYGSADKNNDAQKKNTGHKH